MGKTLKLSTTITDFFSQGAEGCSEGKVLKDEGKFFPYQKSEVSLKSEGKNS